MLCVYLHTHTHTHTLHQTELRKLQEDPLSLFGLWVGEKILCWKLCNHRTAYGGPGAWVWERDGIVVGLATAPGLLAKAKVSLERCHSTQTSQRKSWVSSYPNVTEFMRSRGTWHRPAGTLSNTGQPWPASTVVWKGQGENDHSRFSCLIRTRGFVLLILEQEGETEREKERHRCERETSIGCLLYAPQLEIESTISGVSGGKPKPTNWAARPGPCVYDICIGTIFFGEMSTQVPCPCLKSGYWILLWLSYKISLCILVMNPLSNIWLQIFSPTPFFDYQ